MKKIDQIILWTLGLGFPVVVGLMIWANSIETQVIEGKKEVIKTGGLWDTLGIFFIIWVVLAAITLIRLLINSKLRETMLSKVARIQERDEREVEVSGYAAKFSFFANLALLVLLLFLSSVNLKLKRDNQGFLDSEGQTKHGYIQLGFALKAYDEKSFKYENNNLGKELSYTDLPISKSGIIIFLIVWQMAMYHLSARKKLKVE